MSRSSAIMSSPSNTPVPNAITNVNDFMETSSSVQRPIDKKTKAQQTYKQIIEQTNRMDTEDRHNEQTNPNTFESVDCQQFSDAAMEKSSAVLQSVMPQEHGNECSLDLSLYTLETKRAAFAEFRKHHPHGPLCRMDNNCIMFAGPNQVALTKHFEQVLQSCKNREDGKEEHVESGKIEPQQTARQDVEQTDRIQSGNRQNMQTNLSMVNPAEGPQFSNAAMEKSSAVIQSVMPEEHGNECSLDLSLYTLETKRAAFAEFRKHHPHGPRCRIDNNSIQFEGPNQVALTEHFAQLLQSCKNREDGKEEHVESAKTEVQQTDRHTAEPTNSIQSGNSQNEQTNPNTFETAEPPQFSDVAMEKSSAVIQSPEACVHSAMAPFSKLSPDDMKSIGDKIHLNMGGADFLLLENVLIVYGHNPGQVSQLFTRSVQQLMEHHVTIDSQTANEVVQTLQSAAHSDPHHSCLYIAGKTEQIDQLWDHMLLLTKDGQFKNVQIDCAVDPLDDNYSAFSLAGNERTVVPLYLELVKKFEELFGTYGFHSQRELISHMQKEYGSKQQENGSKPQEYGSQQEEYGRSGQKKERSTFGLNHNNTGLRLTNRHTDCSLISIIQACRHFDQFSKNKCSSNVWKEFKRLLKSQGLHTVAHLRQLIGMENGLHLDVVEVLEKILDSSTTILSFLNVSTSEVIRCSNCQNESRQDPYASRVVTLKFLNGKEDTLMSLCENLTVWSRDDALTICQMCSIPSYRMFCQEYDVTSTELLCLQLPLVSHTGKRMKFSVPNASDTFCFAGSYWTIVSAIQHIGEKWKSGHFVTYVKTDDVWYLHDDDHPKQQVQGLPRQYRGLCVLFLKKVIRQ